MKNLCQDLFFTTVFPLRQSVKREKKPEKIFSSEITYVNQNAYTLIFPRLVEKSVDNVENSMVFAPFFRFFPRLPPVIPMHKPLHKKKNHPIFSCYVDVFFPEIFVSFSPKKLELFSSRRFLTALAQPVQKIFCGTFTNFPFCMKKALLANTVGITFWEEARCREK